MKLTLKNIIKFFVPYGIIVLSRRFRKFKTEYREIHASYGNLYPDITFYIIRRIALGPGHGLYANFHHVLGHIMYALEKNYVPVVDMKNYKTHNNEKEPINGTYNAWEYYFEQPFPYTLDHAYKSKNVILSTTQWLHDKVPFFLETEDQIGRFHDFVEKYMRFNKTTLDSITDQRSKVFGDRKNILGVLYRGTGYISRRSAGHAIIASIDDYINKTQYFYQEWNMDWIYLDTEAEEAVLAFQKHFKDKLIMTQRKRIENYNDTMPTTPELTMDPDRKHDNYLKGLEYIIDTALLSECDAIIAPKVNGAMAALELNGNKYRHKYIYSLGVY